MKSSHVLRFPLALLTAIALVSTASAQGIYLIGKTQFYRQTSAAAAVSDPIRPFTLDVATATNVAVTFPSGAAWPDTLVYEDEEFSYERVFATKAALDAAFPAGTYRMSGAGIPALSLDLSEVYPTASPQITQVTNGTWNSGGILVVNPAQAATLRFSTFSDYGTTAATDLVTMRLCGYTEQEDLVEGESVSRPLLGMAVQSAPINTLTIPANRMTNNRLYLVTIEFIRLPAVDTTSVPEGAVGAMLTKRLDLFIAAQTNATSPAAPTISNHPGSRTASAGSSTTFAATATVPEANRGNIALWYKNGVEVNPGPRIVRAPNGQSLTVSGLTPVDAGDYVMEIVSAGGAVRSTPATLTVPFVPALPRLANLSILTSIAAGESFTMGYVAGGAGTIGAKPLVIRAVGPSLSQLGVANPLDDPKLELFAGATKTLENDNWAGDQPLAAAMASVGAFAFTGPTSRDAAIATDITSADNSVRVSAAGSGSGTVIAELYDATPSASFTAQSRRLVNVSVMKNIGTGLTAGFVIGGSSQRTVLVRAIGPSLGAAPFNVPGVVADPQLALFAGQARIAENNDWGGALALRAAFTQVGAFGLGAGSKDAALIATLPPGNYSVQATGVGGSGVALVEVYELP